MNLVPKDLEKRFKEVGSQEGVDDPIVIAKFFNPAGAGTWLATEYDPKAKIFFGYVTLFGWGSPEDEWGGFSLEELEEYKGKFGIGIERDLWFKEKSFSQMNINKEQNA